MMTLDSWLKQATRHLSKDSVAQVRSEIREHYESARETAMTTGGRTANQEEVEWLALAALGDAKAANRQYRKVLLTSAEASVLREGNWEAKAVCSRPWLKPLLLALPLVPLTAAAVFFLKGAIPVGGTLLAGAVATGFLFGAPFLPIYTPMRARVFRCAKWIALLAVLCLAFGPNAFKLSWLLFSCLWPMAWIEGTRVSLRRKLPVSRWPKQLYL